MFKFQTLYSIVNDEIEARTTNARNSATDALLWLKRYQFFFYDKKIPKIYLFRAFEFLSSLLNEFGMGDKTLADAVSKAYAKSLSRHHGMLARSIFSVNENIMLDLLN